MPERRASEAPLEPGQTLNIRGRRWVIDGLHRGRDGVVQVQVTWKGDRRSETVVWPADAVRGARSTNWTDTLST